MQESLKPWNGCYRQSSCYINRFLKLTSPDFLLEYQITQYNKHFSVASLVAMMKFLELPTRKVSETTLFRPKYVSFVPRIFQS